MAGRVPVAAISGGASGIGLATVEWLRTKGWRTITIDLAESDVVADLSTGAGRTLAFDAIVAACPDGLDACILCAGLASQDGPGMISVNFFGAVELLERVHSLLRSAPCPRAAVVASSSIILETDDRLVDLCLAGDEPAARKAAEGNSLAYASSKLALAHWIRKTSITDQWAGQGILLNAVAPGLVRTAMTEHLLASEEGRAVLEKSAPYRTPWLAGPDHIAPLLGFLASPDNRHMVGQIVFCDGGKEAMMHANAML